MQIHVARAGKELGVFSTEEVRSRLASGEFLPTDHGWAAGQGDWRLLSAFPELAPAKPINLPPPPEPPQDLPPRPEPGRNVRRRKKTPDEEDTELKLAPAVSPPEEKKAEPAAPTDALPAVAVEPVLSPVVTPMVEPQPTIVPKVGPAGETQPDPEPRAVEEAEPEPVLEPEPEYEPEPRIIRLRLDPEPRPAIATLAEPRTGVQKKHRIPLSSDAVLGLTLGILSITLLPIVTAIPAVVVSRIARDRIARARGTLRGETMAAIGLVAGYIGAGLALVALLGALALAFIGFAETKSAQTQSLANGRAIALACRAYASEHQGKFPATLEALVPQYLSDPAVFACPLAGTSEPIGFDYHGGRDSDPAGKPLLVSKGHTPRKRHVVVYTDGTADLVRGAPVTTVPEPAAP